MLFRLRGLRRQRTVHGALTASNAIRGVLTASLSASQHVFHYKIALTPP